MIVSLTDGGRELKAEAFGILRDIGSASGCSLEEVGELRDALHRLTQRLASSRHES